MEREVFAYGFLIKDRREVDTGAIWVHITGFCALWRWLVGLSVDACLGQEESSRGALLNA